jgi:hypothetical protein
MSGKQIRKRQGSLKSAGCGWSLGRGRRRPPILEHQLYQSINQQIGPPKCRSYDDSLCWFGHTAGPISITHRKALSYMKSFQFSCLTPSKVSCMISPDNKASRSAFAAAASRGTLDISSGFRLLFQIPYRGYSGVFQPQHGPAHLACRIWGSFRHCGLSTDVGRTIVASNMPFACKPKIPIPGLQNTIRAGRAAVE